MGFLRGLGPWGCRLPGSWPSPLPMLPLQLRALTPLHIAAALPGEEGVKITELLLHAVTDVDAMAADQDDTYKPGKVRMLPCGVRGCCWPWGGLPVLSAGCSIQNVTSVSQSLTRAITALWAPSPPSLPLLAFVCSLRAGPQWGGGPALRYLGPVGAGGLARGFHGMALRPAVGKQGLWLVLHCGNVSAWEVTPAGLQAQPGTCGGGLGAGTCPPRLYAARPVAFKPEAQQRTRPGQHLPQQARGPAGRGGQDGSARGL